MNVRYSIITNQCVPCDKDEEASAVNSLFVQYGVENRVKNKWKELIQIADPNEAKKAIDEHIDILEKNSNQNGFYNSNQVVYTECSGGFLLDDKNLYYWFFVNLRKLFLTSKQNNEEIDDGTIIFKAIKQTIDNYLGPVKHNAIKERILLTQYAIIEDENGGDEFKFPSIKIQMGKGTGICTERASISHNLWLLAGRESYFFTSKDCKFKNSSDYGHSFNIVKSNNGYRLCDFAMGNFDTLEENPINMIKKKNALVFDSDVYFGTNWYLSKEIN